MATAEYIGALISLISKSDIRYQGLLASINPEQATIALEKVRSWGTEGRVAAQGRAQEEIPPSDHVYEYIMFRAADVKDLKIDDANPPKPPAPAQPALNDPAILNSSAPQSGPGYGAPAGMYGGMMPAAPYGAGAPAQRSPQPPQTVAPPAASSSASASAPAPQPASGASKAARASPAAEAAPKSSADAVLEEMSKLSVSKPAASSSPSSLPAAHGLPAIPRAAAAAAAAAAQSERRNGAGAGASRGAQRERVGGPSMPNREFDFESANAKFQKHGAEGGDEAAGGLLVAIPAPASDSETFYDKSGFFDNISSEIKERYERNPANGGGAGEGGEAASFFDAPAGRGGRGRGAGRGRGRANRMAEEMKNMQTFGDTGASFGGSGGRGRGRGRARGRGRGRANDGSNTAPMRMG